MWHICVVPKFSSMFNMSSRSQKLIISKTFELLWSTFLRIFQLKIRKEIFEQLRLDFQRKCENVLGTFYEL